MSAEAEKSDIDGLLHLVRSHQRQHEDNAYDSATAAAKERCKTMLSKLRKLLPKLMRPISGLSADDAVTVLQKLCELLGLLLSGDICPHSMTLFIEGTETRAGRRDGGGTAAIGSPSYSSLSTMLFYMLSFYTNVALRAAQPHVLRVTLQMTRFLETHDVYAFLHFFRDAVQLLEDAYLLEAYLSNHDGMDLRQAAAISCFLDTAVHVYQEADGPLRPTSCATVCGCMPITDQRERHQRLEQLKSLLPRVQVDSYRSALVLRQAVTILIRQLVMEHWAAVENDRASDRLCQLLGIFIAKDEKLLMNAGGARRTTGRLGDIVIDVVRSTKMLLENLLALSKWSSVRFLRLARSCYEDGSVNGGYPELISVNAAVLDCLRQGYEDHIDAVGDVLWPCIEKFLHDKVCRVVEFSSVKAHQQALMVYWKPIIGIVATQAKRSSSSPPTSILSELVLGGDITMLEPDVVIDTIACILRTLSSKRSVQRLAQIVSRTLSSEHSNVTLSGGTNRPLRKRKRDSPIDTDVNMISVSENGFSSSKESASQAMDPLERLGRWIARLISFTDDNDEANIINLTVGLQLLLPLRERIVLAGRLESATIFRILFQRVEDALKTLGPPVREASEAYVNLWIVMLLYVEDQELSKFQALLEKTLESVECQNYLTSGDRRQSSIPLDIGEQVDPVQLFRLCSSDPVEVVSAQIGASSLRAKPIHGGIRLIFSKSRVFRSVMLMYLSWSRPLALRIASGPSWRMAFPWKMICRTIQQDSSSDAVTCITIKMIPLLVYLVIAEGIATAREVVGCVLEVLNSRIERAVSEDVRSAVAAACGAIACAAVVGQSQGESTSSSKPAATAVTYCCQSRVDNDLQLSIPIDLFASTVSLCMQAKSSKSQLSALSAISRIFHHCISDNNEAASKLLQLTFCCFEDSDDAIRHCAALMLSDHSRMCRSMMNPLQNGPAKTVEQLDALVTRSGASSDLNGVFVALHVLGTFGCHSDLRNIDTTELSLWTLLRLTSLWSRSVVEQSTKLAAAAFDQIHRVMVYQNVSWRRLCVEFPALCYFPLVDELLGSVSVKLFVQTFMRSHVDVGRFLLASAPHVLPKYVIDKKEAMLRQFVIEYNENGEQAGKFEDGSEDNCFEAINIDGLLLDHLEHVLKELLMHQVQPDYNDNRMAGWDFLYKFMPENTTVYDLMSRSPVRLQNLLAWELGGSRYQTAKRAFRTVAQFLHAGRAIGEDDAKTESVGIMLKPQHFLALMTDLGSRISSKGNLSSSTSTKIQAIKSIDRLLDLFHPVPSDTESTTGAVDAFVPKIMATLKIGLIEPELREHGIRAWSTFLRMLSPKALEKNLCSIVVSLLPCLECDASSILAEAREGRMSVCWNVESLIRSTASLDGRTASNTATMNTAISLLRYLFIEKRDVLKEAFPKILMLPSTPELDEIYASIVGQIGDPAERVLHQYLRDVSLYVNHWDVAVREVALAQLFRCLVGRGSELQRLMQSEGDLFIDSAISAVVLSVMEVTRTESSESIKLLCARCLGALGAIDAARMPLSIFMSPGGRGNHKDALYRRMEHSTKDLACVLIESWLVKELRAAPENTDFVAFAIQELLKFLAELTADPQHSGQSLASMGGLDSTMLPPATTGPDTNASGSSSTSMPEWMRRRFERKDVFQFVEPYWATQYTVSSSRHSNRNAGGGDRSLHPALDGITYYEKFGSSYEEWLQTWCRRLIQISQPPERKIFLACRSVLPTCPQIARFLLPYLIQNVLRSGRPDVYREIKREVMTILNDRDEGIVLDEVMMLQDEADHMGDSNTGSHEDSAVGRIPIDRTFGDTSSRHHQCCQTIFSTIDELNDWVWTSEKKRIPSSSSSSRFAGSAGSRAADIAPPDFEDQEKDNLDEFLKDIPSQVLSNAAYRIKAYARAIQYFEVFLRQQKGSSSGPIGTTFYGAIGPVPLGLIAKNAMYLQQLYKSVDEPDALIGFATLRRIYDAYSHSDVAQAQREADNEDRLNLTDLMHQIVDHEQLAQWEDALACYEQAIQEIQTAFPPGSLCDLPYGNHVRGQHDFHLDADAHRNPALMKPELYSGMIGCLIQLGRLESALQHIYGIATQEPQFKGTIYPYALECSWRLSRWDLVTELLSAERQNPLLSSSMAVENGTGGGHGGDLRLRRVDISQLLLVRVLHSLHARDTEAFTRSLNEARLEIMGPLAAASAESYQRAYPLLHKLHFLHEAEQGFIFLQLSKEELDLEQRGVLWKKHAVWDMRYDMLSPSLKYRDPILALRRVILQEADMKNSVSHNWLQYAKLTRKEGYLRTSNSAVMHAEALGTQYALLERAKLLVSQDRMHEALQVLEPVDIDPTKLDFSVEDPHHCAKTLLLATYWMQESGQRQGKKVIERYEAVIKFDPQWEKGYFFLAKYYDYLLSVRRPEGSSTNTGGGSIEKEEVGPQTVVDSEIHNYLVHLMKNYVLALRHGTKFVFQSLPRLLTLWFDYGELLYTRASVWSVSEKSRKTTHQLERETAQAKLEQQVLADMNAIVNEAGRTLPAYEWLMCFPQVASRVCHPNSVVVSGVRQIMINVLRAYPTQAMWPVLGLSRSLNSKRRYEAKHIIAETERAFAKAQRQDIATSFEEGGLLVDELIMLASHDPQNQKKIHIRLSRIRTKILVPIQAALTTLLPVSGKAPSDKEHTAFVLTTQVHISAFTDKAEVMMTKEKPKRIEILGDDGRKYPFLCKREKTGDLRKDARMMEFNVLVNKLLQKDDEGRKRKLRLRTYAVVCLNEESGLIEWVENTRAMRQLIMQIRKTECGFVQPMRLSTVKERYLYMQQKYANNPSTMAAYYRRKILTLPEFSPRFHQWFYNNFADPTAWFEARLTFARSAAVWSMVGHVIGLGDRHGENILIDTTNGECVHVDFDCLFDKGLKLAKPEIVPFRLTPNMIDAFGITGYEGVFRRVGEVTMQLLRGNQATLRSVLESFIHDPLVEWGRRGKSTQRSSADSDRAGSDIGNGNSNGEQGNAEAHAILAAIDDRLRGVYNLGAAIRPHLSVSHLRILPENETLPLSVEGQVDKLIHEATALENLAQMYIGWMPFL